MEASTNSAKGLESNAKLELVCQKNLILDLLSNHFVGRLLEGIKIWD